MNWTSSISSWSYNISVKYILTTWGNYAIISGMAKRKTAPVLLFDPNRPRAQRQRAAQGASAAAEVAALSAKLASLFALRPECLGVLEMMTDRMIYKYSPQSAGGLGL